MPQSSPLPPPPEIGMRPRTWEDDIRELRSQLEGGTIGPDPESGPLRSLQTWLAGTGPGRKLQAVAEGMPQVGIGDATLPSEQAARIGLYAMQGTKAKQFADWLRRAWTTEPKEASTARRELWKLIDKDPTLKMYSDAVTKQFGSTRWLRDALEMTKNDYMEKYNDIIGSYSMPSYDRIKNQAQQLHDLLEQSTNRSTSALFRKSGLEEIPNLKVGETFSNPFLSFSRSRTFAAAPYNSIIRLEPGAKTLPLAGISDFEKEQEHLTGGLFKITGIDNLSSGRKIVTIQHVR